MEELTPEEKTFLSIRFKIDQNRTDFTLEEMKMLEAIGKFMQEHPELRKDDE